MIEYSDKGILTDIQPYSVILHQVDCKGNMTSNLVNSLNKKFNGWFCDYRSYCSYFINDHEDEIEGTFHRFEIPDQNVIICSAFCQKYYSRNSPYTDLDCWKKVISKVLKQTQRINKLTNKNWTIHIQGNIGQMKRSSDNSELLDLFEAYFTDAKNANLVIHN